MGKTVEQRLTDATKKIKADKKNIAALKYQVDARQRIIQKLNAEAQIKDAKLKSSEMFICYLQSLASDNNELVVPLEELYSFGIGYEVEWKMDDAKQEIVIRTHKID